MDNKDVLVKLECIDVKLQTIMTEIAIIKATLHGSGQGSNGLCGKVKDHEDRVRKIEEKMPYVALLVVIITTVIVAFVQQIIR